MKREKILKIYALGMTLYLLLSWAKGEVNETPRPSPAATAVIKITGIINERAELYNIFRPDVSTLQDYVGAMNKARKDPEISFIVIKLEAPQLGWAKATQLRRAILQLRNSGKPTFIYLNDARFIHYYIASAANSIIMSPSGNLLITGIGIDVYYLKELLNKLYIDADLLVIGKYKTVAEPFTREAMSPESREMFNSVLDNFYQQILTEISEGRKLDSQKLKLLIDESPYTAEEALKSGLIDELCYEEELQSLIEKKHKTLIEFVADYGIEKFPRPEEINFVNLLRMLMAPIEKKPEEKPGKKVALIFAVGAILPGSKADYPFSEDIITADDLRKFLQKCIEDDEIIGAVLRVESIGGSAPAADVICNAVAGFSRQKPIVASLGDTAASGGYYIAMAANKVVAEPFTLTGSIGVIGGKLVLGTLYDKIGINKESLTRGKRHQMFSETQSFTPEEKEALLRLLNNVYQNFVNKAAKYRGVEEAEMEKIAQGRLWSGSQAKENKLVDELGGIETAINLVRELARVPAEEEIEIITFPKPPGIIKILRSIFPDSVYLPTNTALNFLPLNILLTPAEFNFLRSIVQLLHQHHILFLSPYIVNIN